MPDPCPFSLTKLTGPKAQTSIDSLRPGFVRFVGFFIWVGLVGKFKHHGSYRAYRW